MQNLKDISKSEKTTPNPKLKNNWIRSISLLKKIEAKRKNPTFNTIAKSSFKDKPKKMICMLKTWTHQTQEIRLAHALPKKLR